MIKLVASDFDGTLLPYGCSKVSELVMLKIKTLIDSGVTFAVASGRTYSELSALMSEISDKIYFICDDGALSVKDGKQIFKRSFDRQSVSFFFDRDLFRSVTFYSLDKAYILGDGNKKVLYGKTPCVVRRAVEITEDIFKITASVKNFNLINSRYFRVHYSQGAFAEFVPPYANKGVALADLQLKLGISKFDTAVLGDADNDIPMMTHANYSYCVGERSKKLSSVCKYNHSSIIEALQDITTNILK